VPCPRVSAQTHRCPKFGPRMGVSSPRTRLGRPAGCCFCGLFIRLGPRCPFVSARWRCPKRGAHGLVSPSILFLCNFFWAGVPGGRFLVLGEAGWDCRTGGGDVSHEADQRYRSLSRLLLGGGRYSAASLVSARSPWRFIFPTFYAILSLYFILLQIPIRGRAGKMRAPVRR
jgi:hypothetical protein